MLKEKIMEVWKGRKGREVYGARKVWLELNRQGIPVARCAVERLMRDLGIGGVRSRRKRPRTTVPGDPAGRPSDLLQRRFDAPAPNRRWVADITYVMTFSGWVYTSFVAGNGLVFDNVSRTKNYKKPVRGSLHTSRGLPLVPAERSGGHDVVADKSPDPSSSR
jgi:HTH-like domain